MEQKSGVTLMEYINLHRSVVDSAEFRAATPAQQGTFMCLLSYLCGQESGDVLPNCRSWNQRMWKAVAGVEMAILMKPCALWCWLGDDLVVNFYPHDEESKTKSMRRGGKIGNQRRWGNRGQTPKATSPPDSPPDSPNSPNGIAEGIRNETKRNETKGAPGDFAEVSVPGLEEFRSACEMRGVPKWFSEHEHAWRSERPGERWPHGVSWQVAVTTTFNRWRSQGAPMEPPKKNGAPKKQSAWEIRQQLETLRKWEAEHPANEQSSRYAGEPTEAAAEELKKIRSEIRQCEAALARMEREQP